MIFNPKFSDFNASCGCEPTIDFCWGKLYVTTEILHHSQLAFYKQALRAIPQKKLSFVEQASCLLLTWRKM